MKAKCSNYSGCLLAYRGEEIEIADGAAMICPECGKGVEKSKPAAPTWMKAIVWIVVAAILGAAGIFGAKEFLGKGGDASVTPAEATPEPKATEKPAVKPAAEKPLATATPAPAPEAEPAPVPEQIVLTEKVDLDLTNQENKKTKAEVLKRVDFMPNLTKQNRDKLVLSVERARKMGIMLTIPFASGKTDLSAADSQAIKNALGSPEVMRLRDDPTAVFVILGYADPKGDPKKNIAVSQARADGVLAVMRDEAKVGNVMHAVAMGGSRLLDAKNLEKNRVVEVWAVLP